MQQNIIKVCKSLQQKFPNYISILQPMQELLLEKNKRYGNAALQPLNIFSQLNSTNSIQIRIDDKLNRIKSSNELRKNDVFDLLGYLILLCISENYTFDCANIHNDWYPLDCNNLSIFGHITPNSIELNNLDSKINQIKIDGITELSMLTLIYNLLNLIISMKFNTNDLID